MKRIAVLLILLACFPCELPAQGAVFVVRHAEKSDEASADAKDPDLSPSGRARAESLARWLRDAGITAVYATEFKRTQQTAEPLARALGIDVTIVPAKESETLVRQLRVASGNALVVAHSNTVPEIVKAIGIDVPVAIAEADYDNLFVVVWDKEPRLLRLHY